MDPFHSDQVSLPINATCPRRSKFDNISTLIQSLNVWHTHPDNVVKYSFRVTLLICPIVNLGHNFEFQSIFLHSAQRSTHLQNLQIHKCTITKTKKIKLLSWKLSKSNSLSLEKDGTIWFHWYLLKLIWIVSLIYEYVYFCCPALVNTEDEKSRNKKTLSPSWGGQDHMFPLIEAAQTPRPPNSDARKFFPPILMLMSLSNL